MTKQNMITLKMSCKSIHVVHYFTFYHFASLSRFYLEFVLQTNKKWCMLRTKRNVSQKKNLKNVLCNFFNRIESIFCRITLQLNYS